jgi:hypothetical protein
VGFDLMTGKVRAVMQESCRSRELLNLLDTAGPAATAIQVMLDNQSARILEGTAARPSAQPLGRFTFAFTPKHDCWLNLIKSFFSKLARSGAAVHSRLLTARLKEPLDHLRHRHRWRADRPYLVLQKR